MTLLNADENMLACEKICSKIWLAPIYKESHTGLQKIGLEMEIFAYDKHTYAPLGTKDAALDATTLLERLWKLIPGSQIHTDGEMQIPISLTLPHGGNFSLEPGGQVEYSSPPLPTLKRLAQDVAQGLVLLEQAAAGQVVFLSHGSNPIAGPSHPLVVPKNRYQIMTRYFNSAPSHTRGIDMMRHSATIQANLDVFGSEDWRDAVEVSLALVPLTRYLFANAQYSKNQASPYLSERQHIWDHMDPSRSGYPFIPDILRTAPCTPTSLGDCPECLYARWAKQAYVFLVPALPLEKQPVYGELTFQQWLQDGYKGIRPTVQDWQTHLGTLFPHLRLRQFLEIRHLDAQPFDLSMAPILFFAALLQNKKTRLLTREFLQSLHIDWKQAFIKTQEPYQEYFKPLLQLARDLLKDHYEGVGIDLLKQYEKFMEKRGAQSRINTMSALDFVKAHATSTPSQQFMRIPL